MGLRHRMKMARQILFDKSFDAGRVVTEPADLGTGQVNIFGGLVGINGEGKVKKNFEPTSIKDLMSEDLDTLIPKTIKSDPAIDQAYDFFTTLTTQDHKVTAETDRAEREILEINQILEERKNSLRLSVMHCASSLIMRGDICIEAEFNDEGEPLNLWVNDPSWVEWRLVSEGDSSRWALGQYKSGEWEEIVSPNVYYLSGNPLVGERSSRAPFQTALFPALSQTSMISSLQTILDVQAWAQTLFSVQKLEMIKIQAADGEIDDVNKQVKEAMDLINKVLSKKRKDQIMGMTDDIQPVELGGSGENLTFTKDIGELYDKRTAMGSKTPSTIGGAQQRADYSTRQQSLFYSLYLQTGQDDIGTCIEWAYKRFLISRGIVDDPIYTSKPMNVESKRIEAEAFQEVMEGINKAVQAGMPLPLAIDFYEEESGTTFSAKLKSRIQTEYVPPQQPTNQNNNNNRSNNNNSGGGDSDSNGSSESVRNGSSDSEGNITAGNDNEFIISAGADYIRKKMLQKIKNDLAGEA